MPDVGGLWAGEKFGRQIRFKYDMIRKVGFYWLDVLEKRLRYWYGRLPYFCTLQLPGHIGMWVKLPNEKFGTIVNVAGETKDDQ